MGLYWCERTGAVLLREGAPYVDEGVLRAGGIASSPLPHLARVVDKKRTAIIPIAAEGPAKPRQAFLNSTGTLYIPLYELNRQGVHEVQMLADAQFMQVLPTPPSQTSQDKDPLTGKPVP